MHSKLNNETKYRVFLGVLGILLIICFWFSFMVGRYSSVGINDIVSAFNKHLLGNDIIVNASAENVILKLRLPRILGSCLIGSALALSGSAYQALFGNPIASPDTLGVSNASSFAAVLGIVLGFDAFILKINAFVVGTVVVLSVFAISTRISGGKSLTTYLLLIGMIFSSLFSALLSILKYVADPDNQLPQITYWLMGSISKVTMADIKAFIFFFAIGAIPLILLRWRMNLLTLSDAELKSMGENVKVLRFIVVICATLLTASSTAMTGGISWVGLIIPHIVRQIVGTDFKKILPVSALLGAIFLLLMDDAARSITVNELPISILTSIIGAPVFFCIVLWTREKFEHDSRI